MLQAARRSWRLGQVDDVEVYYLVYQNTMEHRAVGLIIEKLIASFLLNGDSVEGALLASSQSSDNFLKELAHNLTSGADVPDLQRLFQEKARKAQGATGALLLTPPRAAPRTTAQKDVIPVDANEASAPALATISVSHLQQAALVLGE
jgi:tryptophanyl-tRNA synthetase